MHKDKLIYLNKGNKVFFEKCPTCGNISGQRIGRNTFVRMVPGTKQYYCDECSTEFISFYSVITFTVE